jgi:hypothetical protein
MNLKCKVIFDIKIVKFLTIHLTIQFSANHVTNYERTFKNIHS